MGSEVERGHVPQYLVAINDERCARGAAAPAAVELSGEMLQRARIEFFPRSDSIPRAVQGQFCLGVMFQILKMKEKNLEGQIIN